MAQNQEIQVNLQLIGKYLAGEASPEEAIALDNWREMRLENNDEFRVVARLWDQTRPQSASEVPESRQEWLKIQTKLKATSNESKAHHILLNLHLLARVAAALAIIIGIGILSYFLFINTTSSTYSTVIKSEEHIVSDTLKDMSTVTLAPHSRLSLSRKFPAETRTVQLNGQAFFSVKHLPEKPFIIHTGGIEITVLGTTFNVKNDSAIVTASVSNGMIKMSNNSASILIPTGSTGAYDKRNSTFKLYADSLNRNDYSYATRTFYFYDMSLGRVKTILESAYNVRILFENPSLEQLRINTKFTNQPLHYLLNVISASLGIQYRITGKTVYFFEDADK